MAYSEIVRDASGNEWTFTLPDQITLSQGGASDNLVLNGGTVPLEFNVHFNEQLRNEGLTHGIISIKMADDLTTGEDQATMDNPTSGLRGPIRINFYNELGAPISDPPGGQTMAIYLAGESDVHEPAPPPSNSFHTLYTHFHSVEAADFRDLTLTKSVGPIVGSMLPGDPENAPNWLFLDGEIAEGQHTWGDFTLHRRETAEDDSAWLNFIWFKGALPPPVDHHFDVLDTTSGTPLSDDGTAYSGPVAGIQWEYINLTDRNLNVTSNVPNSFIHTGSGQDAIDVSKANGTNVLDGATGSNFLVGGTGSDTFFVDNRVPTTDIWSTVVNFNRGDAATIWGVTPSGFALNWADNEGATGFTGLTLHATAPDRPTASITLAGFTTSDLINGHLSISFGTDTASGSSYMYVQDLL